ncbi:hypothetical protein PENTCL1PPCAC_18874, partial [Pristionchus entomophagus]
ATLPLKNKRHLFGLALFEQLPCELAWKIIEKVPEEVYQLRLTSQTLKARVDEYSLQATTIPLVESLEVCVLYEKKAMEICLTIPKCYTELFELRMKLRKSEFDWSKRINRKLLGTENLYQINYEDEELMDFVRECTGKKVGTAEINYNYVWNESKISRVLDRFEFRNLRVKIGTITDGLVDHLLKIVKAYNVDSCSVETDNNAASNLVVFLIDLSSRVLSMRIVQPPQYLRRSSRLLFGIHDAQWAPIILDMFSRKLDKLQIENMHFLDYLSDTDQQSLKETLPLRGKKVWFEATCNADENSEEIMTNEHSIFSKFQTYIFNFSVFSVKRDGGPFSTLNIKHTSREQELFEDY